MRYLVTHFFIHQKSQRPMDILEKFNTAVSQSKELPARPSNEDLLQLYALFKQATDGDVSGERPGGFDFKAIAKFNAWEEKKGISKEQAAQEYINLVERLKKELS